MTVPMWMPFALLTAICAVCPLPAWARRVDWFVAISWAGLLLFCLGAWAGVAVLVWWIW